MGGQDCKCDTHKKPTNDNNNDSTAYSNTDDAFSIACLVPQLSAFGYEPKLQGNTITCSNMNMTEEEFQSLLVSYGKNNSNFITFSSIELSVNQNGDNYTFSKIKSIVSDIYRKILNQKLNTNRNALIRAKKLTGDSTTSEISLAQSPVSNVDAIHDMFGFKPTTNLQKKVNGFSVKSSNVGKDCPPHYC